MQAEWWRRSGRSVRYRQGVKLEAVTGHFVEEPAQSLDDCFRKRLKWKVLRECVRI